PHPGQCNSTGSTSTVYMTESTATLLLPYVEQDNVYKLMDHTLTFAQMQGSGSGYDVAAGNLHPKSMGRAYNDPGSPSTVAAAKHHIKTCLCPSVPLGPSFRSPDGFGVWDYMFIASSDIEEGGTGAVTPVGTRAGASSSDPRRAQMAIQGFLSCD